jgi:hypothetical protein
MSDTNIGSLNSASSVYLSNLDTQSSGDLETVMLSLSYQRATTLDNVVSGQVKDMKDRNAEIQKIQSALQEVRNLKPDKDEKGQNLKGQLSKQTIDILEKYGLADSLKETVHIKGSLKYPDGETLPIDGSNNSTSLNQPIPSPGQQIKEPDGSILTVKSVNVSISLSKDGSYAALTENLKTQIDKESSNSQLDMIKLQGLINKRNQTVELMTNLLQKFSQLQEKIVGNIR